MVWLSDCALAHGAAHTTNPTTNTWLVRHLLFTLIPECVSLFRHQIIGGGQATSSGNCDMVQSRARQSRKPDQRVGAESVRVASPF